MISHMLEIQVNDYEMPTSARIVFMVLKRLRIADFRTIEMESGLSKRSVLYAVKRLREMGLIDIKYVLPPCREFSDLAKGPVPEKNIYPVAEYVLVIIISDAVKFLLKPLVIVASSTPWFSACYYLQESCRRIEVF